MKTKKKDNKPTRKIDRAKLPTIAEIANRVPKLPYDTTSKEEYSVQISKMNLFDLQNHAVKLGLRPSSDRQMLEKTLVNFYASKRRDLEHLAKTNAVQTSKPKTLLDLIKNKK